MPEIELPSGWVAWVGFIITVFERNGEFGRTWQYIPSSKISNHELRRVVGDDRMLDHKINGKVGKA